MYDSLQTGTKEFPRSVENQLLQLYHPTLSPPQRQEIGLLAECPPVQQQQSHMTVAYLLLHGHTTS